MANANYWKDRMKDLSDMQYAKTTEYYEDLQRQFRMAQNNLQMDIEHWYQRLADNNDISLAAAKRLLKKNELEEFHWTVEEYIRRGEESSVNPQWLKQLENASARVHINQLEAMKLQTQQHAEMLYQEYERGTSGLLKEIYEDGYYRTAYETARGINIGNSIQNIDADKIDKILKTPWAQDGAVFSDRIWQNKGKLVRELHTELTQSLIRGENPDEAAKRLANTMGCKLSQARTLVYTESAAMASMAQKDSLLKLGVKEFQIVETIDSHTCSTCGEMDGKHFLMSDFAVGVTAPPFHPRCRGCVCPYFDDEFTTGERVARGADGKKYYVPENTTYEEWKKSFVDGDAKEVRKSVANASVHDIMKLSDEELGAIMRYKSFDSYVINDALRNAKDISKLLVTQQQLINNLDSALAKMPKYNGNLIRTVDFSERLDSDEQTEKFVNEYIPGEIIVIDQYWSTSKAEGYSENASVKIYIQNSKNGRDISTIGLNESEVLYERKCRFEVMAKQLDADGVWNILLREVE